MTATCKNVDVRRRVARAASLAVLAVVASALAVRAQTTPSALFQNSTLTGTTNTINVTQLPVVTSTGKIIYNNLVIQFDVADDGTITVASGYPKITPAPTPIAFGFEAGNYFGGGAQSGYAVTVGGPGVVQGGSTEWSLSASSGANGATYPSDAHWYVVANIKNSPFYERIVAAKINPTFWSAFGVVGSNDCFAGRCDATWSTGTLLGLAQTGTQLSISSFTTTNTSTGTQTDNSMPVDTITYCKNSPCGTN
jgi:hypothetical protein